MAGFKRLTLYGDYWWIDGSLSDPATASFEEDARARRSEADTSVDALVSDGWTLVSVVGAQGGVRTYGQMRGYGARLVQETFHAFLTAP